VISVVDQGHIGALMLLDLSAAFDTVDHSILMEVLERRFGVEGNALGWLAEFLRERSQVVRVGESESDSLPLHFSVPQGSVLGPKRFIKYTEDIDDLFVRHDMCHHLFAVDMQGFRSGHPSDISPIVTGVEDCLSDVSSRSAAKRLQLNATKTEILWFGSETNLHKVLPANRVISVGQSVIQPVTVVCDLGVLIDGELSASTCDPVVTDMFLSSTPAAVSASTTRA